MKSPYRKTAAYLLLGAAALPMVAPFLWMLVTSVQSDAGVMAYPPRWIPSPAQWENYGIVADRLHFGVFGWNSLKIATLSTIGQLFSCSLAAYGFARFAFRGREVLFGALLATMVVPYQITMIPLFTIVKWLGLVDTHAALILPSFLGGTFGGAAFGTFLLRQFFETIPRDFVDAAVVDGAGRWRVYWHVMLPLARPALATLGLFVFMGSWNDLLQPAIFLSSPDLLTLPVGLAALQASQQGLHSNLLMAGAVLAVAPVVIMFFAAQKYFVRGLVMSGIKG